MENIQIQNSSANDLVEAHKAVWDVARKQIAHDPVLWAYYDSETGDHRPDVDCCGALCGKPAWEVYAINRGSNLKITLNDRFEFFFGPTPF